MIGIDARAFYDRVGAENGWDFSKLNCQTEGDTVNLYDSVTALANGSEIVLDIGTGGGESVLPLSDAVLLLVGIDNASGMLATANEILAKRNKSNVRFLHMDAFNLTFPNDFFDFVTCRHSDFSVTEVFRVLKPGGVFFTQQVDEADKLNIKSCFGKGQSFGTPMGTLKKQYMQALQTAGFMDIRVEESNVVEYYASSEDLRFLLQHTPIIPDFGKVDDDARLFQKFVDDNMTERGIQTNSARFMITATKQ